MAIFTSRRGLCWAVGGGGGCGRGEQAEGGPAPGTRRQGRAVAVARFEGWG